ncbi:hypothetical protein B0H10DRAFT_1102595 [Mycena sp. CBHHK59/15]|nr:hypothetical protein B0H10DRAFT_1102595 [Mycena sp. CBHHK59/15]
MPPGSAPRAPSLSRSMDPTSGFTRLADSRRDRAPPTARACASPPRAIFHPAPTHLSPMHLSCTPRPLLRSSRSLAPTPASLPPSPSSFAPPVTLWLPSSALAHSPRDRVVRQLFALLHLPLPSPTSLLLSSIRSSSPLFPSPLPLALSFSLPSAHYAHPIRWTTLLAPHPLHKVDDLMLRLNDVHRSALSLSFIYYSRVSSSAVSPRASPRLPRLAAHVPTAVPPPLLLPPSPCFSAPRRLYPPGTWE